MPKSGPGSVMCATEPNDDVVTTGLQPIDIPEDDEVNTDNLTPLMGSGRRKTNSFRFNLRNAQSSNATVVPKKKDGYTSGRVSPARNDKSKLNPQPAL